MAKEVKDKAFEGADAPKDDKVEQDKVANDAETAPKDEATEEKHTEKNADKAEKTDGKGKKDKAFDKNAIKVGDFVVYEAAHGNRCVQVLEVDENAVTVVGDEGSRVKVSLSKVKKSN